MSGHHKLHPSFKDEENGKILPYDFFKDKEYDQEVKIKMESKESDFDVQTKLWDLTNQDDIKKLYSEDFCAAENRKQGRYISDNIVLEFKQYGLSNLLRNIVGALKISLATVLVLGIWYPEFLFISASMMAFLMLCAQFFHFKAKNNWIKFMPSLSLLILSIFIAKTVKYG